MAEPIGLAALCESYPEVRRYVENRHLSAGDAARNINAIGHTTSERAVNRLRAKRAGLHTGPGHALPRTVSAPLPKGAPEPGSGKMTLTGEEGEFHDVAVEEPILNGNWDHVFERFNLDPSQFQIVDDTVRISTWQQSKRLENGDRDTINLYSYSARFKRRSDSALSPETIERWKTNLLEFPPLSAQTSLAAQGTYVIEIADPQLGKKGTAQAVENWQRGVLGHLAEIERMRRAGVHLEGIHVAWMGDEIENVANNYTNQSHTIELNLSQQLELDFDLRMWTLREVMGLGLPVSASSVVSNHGEWTRNGTKDPVTSKNDNASTHIARQVKKAFDALHTFGVPAIDWTIGDSSPGIVVPLSGVECYFTHAHIEKGKGPNIESRTKDAIQKQILGDIERFRQVRLYFTAHYHHAYLQEFEGKTLFGAPALEALRSSEYMQHQFGVWSPPGMTGLIVGRDIPRGWSNLNIF